MGRVRKRYRAIVRRAAVFLPTSSPSDDDSRQEDENDNLAINFEDLDDQLNVPHMNTPTASLQLGTSLQRKISASTPCLLKSAYIKLPGL